MHIPKLNETPVVTSDIILQILKKSPNKRHSCRGISGKFGITESQLKKICEGNEKIKFERATTGKFNIYFFQGDQKKETTLTAPSNRNVFKGEYKMDSAMQTNIARCQADRGGEFHPISIS